jgi:DNA polymerase-3 subunit delta'
LSRDFGKDFVRFCKDFIYGSLAVSSLLGQPQAMELLERAIALRRIAPAYLFVGAAGIGRGLAAKYFCQCLLSLELREEKQTLMEKRMSEGNHPDLLWVQPTYQHQGQFLTAKEAETAGLKRKAPPQLRIEQIRQIIQFLSRPPLEASRAVVVIEDAQTMTEAAANALLKTLEEPGQATLILIAPSVDSLLPTLVSRCQRIPFYRLAPKAMKQVLQQTGYQDILQSPELLAIAEGSPGEAIAIFEQLKAIPSELRQSLTKLPKNPLKALELAKMIEQELDTQAQLCLLDYLQYFYGNKNHQKDLLKCFEKARQCLLSYVQPRLVWECTLLNLTN